MQSQLEETEEGSSTTEAPPIPGVMSLAWLLFMQPLELHRLFAAWGLEKDPSLWALRGRSREPLVRALLWRWALMLFVGGPLVGLGTCLLLSWVIEPFDWLGVAWGVALGVALGVAWGVAGGVVFGVAFGVALGVALGVAWGVAGGVALGVAWGVAGGVAGGVAFSVAFSVAGGVAVGVAFSVAVGVAWGVAWGVGGGVAFAVGGGVAGSVAWGVAVGVAGSVAFIVSQFKIVSWLIEAPITLGLATLARFRPANTRAVCTALPYLHHDLIYLPLPGLAQILVRLAKQDPTHTMMLLGRAAASPGQKGIARRVSIELQARALEHAAQHRHFALARALDLPFLPAIEQLSPDSPLQSFVSAAKDLLILSPQRQRELALERTRKTLNGFIHLASGRLDDGLYQRLIFTARTWLDLVADENAKLTEAQRTQPEVPTPFIAGNPVTPRDADGPTLFVGRDDLIHRLDHDLGPERRGVVLVTGQRRMGKSSLRGWLGPRLGTGTRVVEIDFQGISGDTHREVPHRMIIEAIAVACPEAGPLPEGPRWGEGLRWLEALDAELTKRGDLRLLVVLDEIERIQDGIKAGWCSTDVLDFLRAVGDANVRTRFLLLTAYPLQQLGPHWVDRLVSVTQRSVSYLDETAAIQLLKHPIDSFPDIYPEGGVARILEQTACHPYLLQKVGDELCRLLNERKAVGRRAGDDELTEVFDIVVADAPLFPELWRQRSDSERAALRGLAEGKLVESIPRSLVREGYVTKGEHARVWVPLFARWITEYAEHTPRESVGQEET